MRDNNPQTTIFDDAVRGNLHSDVMNVDRIEVEVKISDVMEEMARAIHEGINQVILKELTFTPEELVTCFKILVCARIRYVRGERGIIHPKEWMYPTIIAPVLECVGIYEDLKRGIIVTPKIGEEVEFSDEFNRKRFEQIMFWLEANGMFMSRGLPMEKKVDDPSIYQLDVVNDVLAGTALEAPNPVVVMSRVLLNLSYLSALFGDARVMYSNIRTLEAALRSAVARNVQSKKLER